MPHVELRDFSVVYPAFTLGPVNLSLAPGERVALVGPNGAGKSTTLKGAVGLLPEYRGSVAIDGAEVGEAGERVRQSVGVLPERVRGFGWMTVAQHLSFLASFYPTWDEGYAGELARRLDLPGGTRLANLSKGNGVKLSFVAAEAYRPPLLLLDEPTSGLDPVMRMELLDLLEECAPRQGERTVLFSSHILEDVEAAADRVLALKDGRLLLDDSVERLRRTHPDLSLPDILRGYLAHA